MVTFFLIVRKSLPLVSEKTLDFFTNIRTVKTMGTVEVRLKEFYIMRNMGSMGQVLQPEQEISSTDSSLNTSSGALGMDFGSYRNQLRETRRTLKLSLSGR